MRDGLEGLEMCDRLEGLEMRDRLEGRQMTGAESLVAARPRRG